MNTADRNRRDRKWMQEALSLAALGAGRTSPNPMVGAIVVDAEGEPAGRGWHERAGAPHAEVMALREAGERARGGTLYLTLEPCAHQGRTPPCAPAVAEAGISRVVAAVEDPDPRVAGNGFEILKAAGISVEVGLLADRAVRMNEAFFVSIRESRPFVTLKMAMSLDGRIATRGGQSRWITGEASRAWAHEFRDRVDAILVGVETVLKDDPLLTARPEGREGKPLIRIVLDSRLRTPREARTLPPDRGIATIIAAVEGSDPEKARELTGAGAEVVMLGPGPNGRVALGALLNLLAGREVRHLLVEGGGRVHAAFLDEGLADRVMAFIAPMIIGDSQAPGAVSGGELHSLEDAPKISHMTHELIGGDILIQGYLNHPVWADFEESPDV